MAIFGFILKNISFSPTKWWHLWHWSWAEWKSAGLWSVPNGYPISDPNPKFFFQYSIRTQFVFKIIGYFGYRVFQNTMFLTWKTASRSKRYWPISSSIIFIWLNWTSHYFIVLWANFIGTLFHYYITPVFLWVLQCHYGKLFPPKQNKCEKRKANMWEFYPILGKIRPGKSVTFSIYVGG